MRAARTRVRVTAIRPRASGYVTSNLGPAYEGASMARRTLGWIGGGGSANALLGNVTTLRNRIRQLVRNNPWAARAVSVFASEVVGTGIRPMSRAPGRDLQNEIQELWGDWVAEADADGVNTFYGLEELVAWAGRKPASLCRGTCGVGALRGCRGPAHL